MTKYWCVLIAGVLLFAGSLWGVSFGLHFFDPKHWAHFPTFMTGISGMIGGAGLILVGASRLTDFY